MSGWTLAANSSQSNARRYFDSRVQATAKITAKAARFRGFRYWSMIYSAVPATGRDSKPATKATEPRRARTLGKHKLLIRQQASISRKTDVRCQISRPASNGRWVTRIDPATKFGNRVMRACDWKNSWPVGNRERFRR